MTSFRVGQKVVCINASCEGLGRWRWDAPKEGEVYTIIGLETVDDNPGVILNEIKNIYRDACGNIVHSYAARRFRPVVERKTDISIFKEILAGTRQPQGVEA